MPAISHRSYPLQYVNFYVLFCPLDERIHASTGVPRDFAGCNPTRWRIPHHQQCPFARHRAESTAAHHPIPPLPSRQSAFWGGSSSEPRRKSKPRMHHSAPRMVASHQ
jgi:hypothetical protein